ncbi:hypothetical protein Tco_1356822, partial [Tanacetum coccineum]
SSSSSSSEFPIAPVTAPLGIRRWKRVGPLPARRLACRYASPRSSDHRSSSSSSSSDSLPVNSSSLDTSHAPDQDHSGSSARDCAAPLSTLYPPTTSESSSGDSSERPLHSSSHSAGPSCKRCRSPIDSRECTYQDFMKCQPLSFKGTEGVVGLIRWSEKM